MHRDTPSCATQQPGLPPPLLSVRAQQARPLPKHTPHEGHARASFRNACRQRTNDSDAIAKGCPLHLSHPGPIAHIRTPLHTCFILACVAGSTLSLH